ncbi:hypothetical protein [Crenothrix sp.]|uniref:hypothetical protein n=1 Tax=Crenothrix sp. TaxID=3100433 RepID=UPI00374D2E5A
MNISHAYNVSQAYKEEIRTAIEADCLLLENGCKNAFLSAYALDISRPDFAEATLPQMWSMEIFILKSLSCEQLSRRMWIIREKFRLQAGDAVYASYAKCLPESISDEALQKGIGAENYPLLKEDAINLIRQMQRMNYYRVQRNIEINTKKKLPIIIFFLLLVAGILLFSVLKRTDEGQSWQLILLTVYFGMIGAVVSLLQRLEQASNTPTNFTDSAINSTDIGQGMSNFYMVSLVVSGAVFSVLVYLLARSQLINVLDLLPKPNPDLCKFDPTQTQNTIEKFLCDPYDSAQTAKLLILCFISGFAERFVPDVLDSLIRRAKT